MRSVSKLNDEGFDLLRGAIINSAWKDFALYYTKYKRRRNYYWLNELHRIIDFVLSGWFVYLSEGKIPQIDAVYGLVNKYINKEDRELVLKPFEKKLNNLKKNLVF